MSIGAAYIADDPGRNAGRTPQERIDDLAPTQGRPFRYALAAWPRQRARAGRRPERALAVAVRG